MKLAISGTYSSGKTMTVMALSYYTGAPRTLARSIREILPEAVPGKSLAQCTWAEFLHLMVRRHIERVVHEGQQTDPFISDGSSLQEWVFGKARVAYGTMNPADVTDRGSVEAHKTAEEMSYFDEALDQFGREFKRHVGDTYDAFVHLQHELPLAEDGHRPMNENFRTTCDDMILNALNDLDIPHYAVRGTVAERLDQIVHLLDLPAVMEIEDAIALARSEHSELDMRLETERAARTVGS